jgi:hypothetical protein
VSRTNGDPANPEDEEAAMDLYRCFVYDQSGTKPTYRTIHAETAGHAKRIALDLLRDDPVIEKMEVWRDADLAFQLCRNQARLEGFGEDGKCASNRTG